VQDKCIMTLDRRLLPGEDPKVALLQISRAIGTGNTYKIEVRGGAFMYPAEVSRDSIICSKLEEAIAEMLGKKSTYEYAHVSLDAGYLNLRGIETVGYGAGNFGLAHTQNDVVSIQDVINATKVYSYLAAAAS